MQMSQQEAERLFKEAIGALQAGRANDARVYADQLVEISPSSPQLWLLQATACGAQGEHEAQEAALDRLLALDPRSIRGLIMKGDCRSRVQDNEPAGQHYRAALMIAEGQDLDPQIVAELRRAEAALDGFKMQFAAGLEEFLLAQQITEEGRSARFRQSLDIMSGRKQVYFQEPTGYFFPGLPQIQYYEREDFDWVGAIEQQTDAIRDEIQLIMRAGTKDFRPYIQSESNKPRVDQNPLLDSAEWSALFLCENSVVVDEVVNRCPATWTALQSAPMPFVDNSGPTAMFSLLRPGARINPHTGVFNTRLICHLPLIVPPDCRFRVGNEIREWEEGKMIIFDDTIEHEAWNDSDEDRVVLIFDIWRPELSDQEKREVSALLSYR